MKKPPKLEKKFCPICLGGKKVTSSSGSNYARESERPCGYCDGTGLAREKPLYSSNKAEEERIWEIRDNPGDRVRAIARARAGNRSLPLHPTELLWLREGLSRGHMIPMLSPVEWDALVAILMSFLSEKEVAARRAEWESQQKPHGDSDEE